MTCDHTTARSAGCDTCADELPVNPYLALRVAYGMLLGEDEFRVLAGNPRGKHMMHSAWLHRAGIVWGLGVKLCGTQEIVVAPGLADDGIGRQLQLEASTSVNLDEWVRANATVCGRGTVHASVEIRFDCCATDPVPTVADTRDVTRKHDDYSRIVETCRIVIDKDGCRAHREPYHRTRVLLGIDEVGKDDPSGREGREARVAVGAAPPAERAAELLRRFRAMSALDCADIAPPDVGPQIPGLFPELPRDSGVTLACLEIDVCDTACGIEVGEIRVHDCCRRALLPTRTIEDLLCGLAPGVIGPEGEPDAGGPQVIPGSVRWSHDRTRCCFTVTAPLNPYSLRRAIHLTSLPDGRGWVDEDIDSVRLVEPTEVEIVLADRPVTRPVRLIVKGTGPTPVFGSTPAVPLNGVVGGPPGTVHDGHDAVLMVPLPDKGATQ